MAMAAAAIAGRNRRLGGMGMSSSYGSSYSDRESEGPNMCWMAIFAVAGVSLVVTGVMFADASFADPRAEDVSKYNAEVDMWSMKFREEFESSHFSWRLLSPESKTVHIPATTCPPEIDDPDCTPTNATDKEMMVAVNLTTLDKSSIPWDAMSGVQVHEPLARGQKTDDIHEYDGLLYEGSGIFPDEPDGSWDDTTWTGAPYFLEIKAEMKDGHVTTYTVGPIPLMKQVRIGANQKMCRIHNGNNMHHGHCYDTFALSHLCIQLNQTSSGWMPDANGGIGCNGMNEAVYDKHCPGSRGLLSPLSPSCNFEDVNITLRSSNDPHVKALQLTHGTLNFGSTPSENWRQGMVLIIVGALLLCPVAPSVYYHFYQTRKNYRSEMSRDEFDALRAGSSRSASPAERAPARAGRYRQQAYPEDVPYAQAVPDSYKGGATHAREMLPSAGSSRGGPAEEGAFVRDVPEGRRLTSDENV